MRGNFDLAQHYIYGTVLHEDEWRRQELKDHDFPESVKQAVVMHVNRLMKMAYYLKLVILRLDGAGSLREPLAPSSGRPT